MDLALNAKYLCLKTTAYMIMGMKKSPLIELMSDFLSWFRSILVSCFKATADFKSIPLVFVIILNYFNMLYVFKKF